MYAHVRSEVLVRCPMGQGICLFAGWCSQHRLRSRSRRKVRAHTFQPASRLFAVAINRAHTRGVDGWCTRVCVVQMRVRDARARARESESARGHVAENARKQGTCHKRSASLRLAFGRFKCRNRRYRYILGRLSRVS